MLGVALLAFAGVALLPRLAKADYSIPAGPYSHAVGPNGTYLIEDSTPLDPTDVQNYWNSATGFSRVLVPGGGIDCGIYDGCVLFDTEGTSLIGVASCTLDYVGYQAAIFIDTDSEWNLADSDCHGIGSDYHPTFVLVLDSSANDYTHIGRHEVGLPLAWETRPTLVITRARSIIL
jgi:hypothetical protein